MVFVSQLEKASRLPARLGRRRRGARYRRAWSGNPKIGRPGTIEHLGLTGGVMNSLPDHLLLRSTLRTMRLSSIFLRCLSLRLRIAGFGLAWLRHSLGPLCHTTVVLRLTYGIRKLLDICRRFPWFGQPVLETEAHRALPPLERVHISSY